MMKGIRVDEVVVRVGFKSERKGDKKFYKYF